MNSKFKIMKFLSKWACILLLMNSVICEGQMTFVKVANLNTLNFGQCLLKTADNGYIMVGQDKFFIPEADAFCHSYITKIDSCFGIDYRVNFEHNGNPRVKSLGPRSIVETASPNKFVMTGVLTKRTGANNMYVAQLDITSGFNWIHEFVKTPSGESQGAYIANVTGGYVACGFVDAEPKKPYIVKLDLSGNVVWDKAFSSLAGLYSYANYVEEFSNGDLLLLGSYGDGISNNFYAMRLSSTGTVIWSKEYDVAQFDGQDWDVSGKILSDGNFIISGSTKQSGNYNTVLIKGNSTTGAVMLATIIDNAGQDDRGRSVMELSNGNFVQVGYTASTLGVTHILMNNVSANFSHNWSRTMNLNNYSKAWSISESCDKGVIYSGESFDGSNYDALFVKTDSLGLIYGCNYSETPVITAFRNPSLATMSTLNIPAVTSGYLFDDYPANEFSATPASGSFITKCINYRDTFLVNKTEICTGDTFFAVVKKINCVPYTIKVSGLTSHTTIFPYRSTNHSSGLDTSFYVLNNAENYSIDYSTKHGCTPFASTKNILVHPSPVVNITSSPSICQNNLDTLYAHVVSGTAPFTYAWSGIGSNLNAPVFPLNTNAPLNVKLTITDNFSCKSASAAYNLENNPLPQLFVSVDAVCLNSTSTFVNNTVISAGTVVDYDWSFYNLANAPAVTSNLINPTFVYSTCNQSNFAKLVATSDKGCKDSVSIPVTVYCNPIANFTSDSVCMGSATHLVDASDGNGHPLYSYSWDFGNNSILDNTGLPGMNYVFPHYGNTAVSYTVYSAPVATLNCRSSITKPVWVNPNPDPVFSVLNKCINEQPFMYNASASSIAIGTNTSFVWSYGDAGSGAGTMSTHTFANAGSYTTRLTVSSSKGCVSTVQHDVEVYEKPWVSISNSSTCDRKPMSLSANSLPNSGHVNYWSWDVNNTISTIELRDQTTSYIFLSAGMHTVSLVTETNKGCKDTLQKQVYVNYLPVPLFKVDKPAGCYLPLCVMFTDETLPVPAPAKNIKWTWLYGDGSGITTKVDSLQPHCFSNLSNNELKFYSVKLIITTDSGCVDSLSKPNFITVYPKPLADYTINPKNGNVVTPFEYFTNTSLYYTKWWWNFGDKDILDSTTIDPTHFYDSYDVRTYYTSLIVKNQYGCSDTASVPLTIGPEFVFYIPNAFTPDNKDGLNDVFTGKGIGIVEYEMYIFDRWGTQIYYTEDISAGWNGHVQGRNDKCKQDVYTWKVKLKDVFGKTHEYIGHVTLLE